MSLLAEDSWNCQYELTYSLYNAAIEAEYVNSNYLNSKALIDIALEKTINVLEKSNIYQQEIHYHTSQGDFIAAINTGLLALEILGNPLPRDLENLRQMSEQLRSDISNIIINNTKIADLANLPLMDNSIKAAIIKILVTLIPPIYFSSPELLVTAILLIVDLSVHYGNIAYSAYGYCLYGLLLCGTFNDIDSGYEFGCLSLQVVEQFPNHPIKCQVHKVFASHIQPWKEPLCQVMTNFQIAIQSGLETGNIEYLGYGSAEYCMYLFFSGENLDIINQKFIPYVRTFRKI
ncbi:MAG: hypothetical protein HC908_13305 [Calothrix sp. SM1_7_51]|nr:hypothetical protein [Calothrix sp. SM1_7_51]